MAPKRFFDVKVSGKSYDKFVNSEFTLHVHRMHWGEPQFYFALNNKGGECAYTIRECATYRDVENEAKAFLNRLQQTNKFNF